MMKGIIVASFGTTHKDTMERTIEAIENLIIDEYPRYPVVRAFTSGVVIRRLREDQGLEVRNLKEALEFLHAKGVTDIYIQPLHIIGGMEFEKVIRAARDFMKSTSGVIVRVGEPLLWKEKDYRRVAETIGKDMDLPLVLMGHGSRHSADSSYDRLIDSFKELGHDKVFLGSVEGGKTLEDVMGSLKGAEIHEVELRPFMLVAGDHAKNDMASDEDEDSWKRRLENEGLSVRIQMAPLGEMDEIQKMFITKLKEVLIS